MRGLPVWENETLLARRAGAGHLFCSSAWDGSAPRSCPGPRAAAGRPLRALSGAVPARPAPGLARREASAGLTPTAAAVPSEPRAWPWSGAARCPGFWGAALRRAGPGLWGSRGALPRGWRELQASGPCPGEGPLALARGCPRRTVGSSTVRGAHACRGPVDEAASPARGPRRTRFVLAVRKPVCPPHPLMGRRCWAWGVRVNMRRPRQRAGPSFRGPRPSPPTPSRRGGLTPGERVPCSVTQGRPRERWPRPGWRGSRRAAHGPRQPRPPRKQDRP